MGEEGVKEREHDEGSGRDDRKGSMKTKEGGRVMELEVW